MKVVAIFLMSLGMALAMLPMEETETAQLCKNQNKILLKKYKTKLKKRLNYLFFFYF